MLLVRRSISQLVEQCLGVFEVRRIEALGEPDIDVCQHGAHIIATTSFVEQPREAHGCAQLPRFRTHAARERDGLAEAGLG